ncbi:hypothetical protein G8759_28495 [Spirosoma aureum]|uniref:Lipocalin-like domain-containing protein n=1 Tax=Spirosoma aureum TaxID=2692134 RepID=A0A6G9AUZ2_9BACT|nr:lipocalin family protein [Spirosoma aureum]QIP16302.1 hypothetical protein G8759_28495 [Spirosoma aureum]
MNRYRLQRWFGCILGLSVIGWLGSCRKDDGDVIKASSIEGNWTISAYKVDPAVDLLGNGQKTADLFVYYGAFLGDDVIKCVKQAKITFNAGGKITTTPIASCSTVREGPIEDGSTWTLTGPKLTITNSRTTKSYDAVVSGNTLKMSKAESDDFDGDGKLEPVVFILELIRL